ncbi:MAG: cystathionine beta-lyase [Alphaproteobacteria bacterium]|nr:MAG: cystathionine beta-lyase [Alphaproteobacteria bacterium]
MGNKNNYYKETKLMHAGRNPDDYFGVVNPPICRTSTILYKDLDAYFDPNTKFRYGRVSNPLSNAFEEAISELEGGFHAITASSGMAAISTTLLSFVKAGDHLLMVDSCYPPTRFFANKQLRAYGVEIEYYDPMIGAGIKDLIRDNTAVIYLESPGSATFEVQDVPAIVKIAKAHDILTIMDNTYSAGVLFRPLEHGVNISVQSAAKYLGGHSDVNLGVAVADTETHYKILKSCAMNLGTCAGAEDLYLSLRGFRTLEMRMNYAQKNMHSILAWFEKRKEVQCLYSPILETNRGYDLWKRDFSGANGVFSVLFRPEYQREDITRFVDSLALFPVGSSWGGYESLIQPQDMKSYRSNWTEEGFFLRFQIGNENSKDLIDDLEQGILNLKA